MLICTAGADTLPAGVCQQDRRLHRVPGLAEEPDREYRKAAGQASGAAPGCQEDQDGPGGLCCPVLGGESMLLTRQASAVRMH